MLLDIAHKIRVIQSVLFDTGYLKQELNSFEVARLYSELEELAKELSRLYDN